MLRGVRRTAPVALVPAAWLTAIAAHTSQLSLTGLLIAHLVMAGFIAFFTVAGWSELSDGALLVWRRVLVAGFAVTLAGVIGLLTTPPTDVLLGVSLFGWMLLPAVGLARTAVLVSSTDGAWRYLAGSGLSIVGTGVYVASLWAAVPGYALVGLALVAAGQTIGIGTATVRDTMS